MAGHAMEGHAVFRFVGAGWNTEYGDGGSWRCGLRGERWCWVWHHGWVSVDGLIRFVLGQIDVFIELFTEGIHAGEELLLDFLVLSIGFLIVEC